MLLKLLLQAVPNIFENSLSYCLRLKIELPCGEGATPVAHMAPRFALDVAIWATNMSPLLRVDAHKSLCLCRGEIHTFA